MVLSSKREHRANTRSMCVLAALTLLVDNIRLPRHRLVEAVDVAEAWLAVVLPQHINHERNALFHGLGGLEAAQSSRVLQRAWRGDDRDDEPYSTS